jgi:hypothetical protein
MGCGGACQDRAYSAADGAIGAFGFTVRQGRFLVLVLQQSGVCLPRQHRAFAGIAHGRQTHRFFEKLVRGGLATTDLAAPAHAGRIYHLQYKPWYRALGEPDHRHRRAMSMRRAVALSTVAGAGSGQDVSWCKAACCPNRGSRGWDWRRQGRGHARPRRRQNHAGRGRSYHPGRRARPHPRRRRRRRLPAARRRSDLPARHRSSCVRHRPPGPIVLCEPRGLPALALRAAASKPKPSISPRADSSAG